MSAAGVARWARLSFRLHRWEVLAMATGVVILAGAMLWMTGQLRALAEGNARCPDPASFVAGCEQFAQQFLELGEWGRQMLNLSWGAPFVAGLVLGVPLVARELEHRTAGMAWTLSRSRAVWLARRVAFLALVLIGLLGVLAVVSEVLAAALLPTLSLDSDFTWYGRRGFLLVPRGLVALAIGVLVGATIGRLLPAMLLAPLAAGLVFIALSFAMDRWNESEAVVTAFSVDPVTGEVARGGALLIDMRIELPSGELISWEVASERNEIEMINDTDGAIYARYDEETGQPDRSSQVGWLRDLLVPGHLYPQILQRESAVAVGIAAVLMALAAGVVGRRRPA